MANDNFFPKLVHLKRMQIWLNSWVYQLIYHRDKFVEQMKTSIIYLTEPTFSA